MNYITIYFKESWHVSGVVDSHNFDWTCKSEDQANLIAQKLLGREYL